MAAFLVIVRHANGRPPEGLAPHRFSGAGVNAVHEKAGLSEETARGAVQRLVAAELIRPAPAELRRLRYAARWEIDQGTLDIDLPHLLTDSAEGVNSALKRIRAISFSEARKDKSLADVSDSELRLDVLRTLLGIYAHTAMTQYGGLSPRCCYRRWAVRNQAGKRGGIRWGLEPETETAYFAFMAECLGAKAGSEVSEVQQKRYWTAWGHLKKLGLIYEAVSLFDVDPAANPKAHLRCTLRVNDFHAGASDRGDPSLLRELEQNFGSTFAYYTRHENDRDEPEAMWVVLPDKAGFVIGIWRPRFRASNVDAGSWFESDSAGTRGYLEAIASLSPDEDLSD